MKKKAIVLLAFTAALTAVSCQKEAMKEAETTPTGEGMTISAVSEGIGADTKADLAYKYDVIWRTGDEICVRNSQKSVRFTLVDGAGTTKGTFRSTGDDISGEVEGFYPASVANLIWPAEQQNNQVPPMYCKKTLSSTQNQTFNFASLGSVLQLTFSTTSSDIILKSIEVKADEAMSGAFTVENGQAKVSQPEGDKPGITLDLGDEGVKVGVTAKKFNIAIPAGEYHGLSIIFTATDGTKCTINAKKDKAIEIVFNTVNTLAVSGEFKPGLPDGALPGVFTISDDGGATTKQICFSQGNLTYDVNASTNKWKFYEHQHDCAANGNASSTLISLFTWGYSASTSLNPTGDSYVTAHPNDGDKLVYDKASSKEGDDWGVAYCESNNITVGTWRTLSKNEWTYLFSNHTKKWASVNGVNGYVIAPDGFDGELAASYADDAALAAAGNLVFLPAAGLRNGSLVLNVGGLGFYWSSTAFGSGRAYRAGFSSDIVYPDDDGTRYDGYSVRLITESK